MPRPEDAGQPTDDAPVEEGVSVPAHIKAARRQQAERLLREEVAAQREASIFRKLKDDNRHPANDASVQTADTKVNDAKTKLDAVLGSAGLSRADVESTISDERKKELQGLVAQWSAQKDIHQDFIDNPAAYGGMDLSGQPLVEDQQKRMVAELEAAVAAANEELQAL